MASAPAYIYIMIFFVCYTNIDIGEALNSGLKEMKKWKFAENVLALRPSKM